MLNGACEEVIFGVTVLPCAEEILEPTGMGVVELFIVIVKSLIGPGIPDQFSKTMAIPSSDSNRQASTISWLRVIGFGVLAILAGATMMSRCTFPHPYGNAVPCEGSNSAPASSVKIC